VKIIAESKSGNGFGYFSIGYSGYRKAYMEALLDFIDIPLAKSSGLGCENCITKRQ